MKNDNCLYFHINKKNNEIFYVGIGAEERPYSVRNRNKWWHNIVNKYGYLIEIISKNLTWEEAKILEIIYINKIGRKDLALGPLVNLTDGGEGCKNLSLESIEKIALSNTGKKRSDTTKLNLSKSHLGHKQSEDTKKK